MRYLGVSNYSKQLKIQEINEPELGNKDVKIEVKTCLLCGSEAHQYRNKGYVLNTEYFYNFNNSPDIGISGHEFTGLIKKIGNEVKKFKVGDRVVVATAKTHACGKCEYCLSGEFCLCKNRWDFKDKIIYGGFAKYYYGIEDSLYKLPDNISYRDGAFIEPLACCIKGTNKLEKVKKGNFALISGPGVIGILTAILMKIAGAKTIILGKDRDKKRFELVRKFGIDYILNIDKTDWEREIKHITKGKGVDAAFECAGSKDSIMNCLKSLKYCGEMIQMGVVYKNIEFDYDIIFFKNLTIKASFGSNENSWKLAIDLLKNGMIDLSFIKVPIYKLESWEKAFNRHELSDAVTVQIKA